MSKFHVMTNNSLDHESNFQMGIDNETHWICIVNMVNGETCLYDDERMMRKHLDMCRKRPEIAEVLGWCRNRSYTLIEKNSNEQV